MMATQALVNEGGGAELLEDLTRKSSLEIPGPVYLARWENHCAPSIFYGGVIRWSPAVGDLIARSELGVSCDVVCIGANDGEVSVLYL